jgi:hypothetical protein
MNGYPIEGNQCLHVINNVGHASTALLVGDRAAAEKVCDAEVELKERATEIVLSGRIK